MFSIFRTGAVAALVISTASSTQGYGLHGINRALAPEAGMDYLACLNMTELSTFFNALSAPGYAKLIDTALAYISTGTTDKEKTLSLTKKEAEQVCSLNLPPKGMMAMALKKTNFTTGLVEYAKNTPACPIKLWAEVIPFAIRMSDDEIVDALISVLSKFNEAYCQRNDNGQLCGMTLQTMLGDKTSTSGRTRLNEMNALFNIGDKESCSVLKQIAHDSGCCYNVYRDLLQTTATIFYNILEPIIPFVDIKNHPIANVAQACSSISFDCVDTIAGFIIRTKDLPVNCSKICKAPQPPSIHAFVFGN